MQFSVDCEDIRNWTKGFWYDWQKLHSISPDFCWGTHLFFEAKFIFLNNLCTLGKRLSHIAQKSFCPFSRTCIVRVQDKRLEGNLTWKKFISISSLTLSGKLSTFELTFPKHALNEGLWTYSIKYNESKKKWG